MTVLKSLTVRASLFLSTGLGSTKRFILFLPQPSGVQLISKVINCVLILFVLQSGSAGRLGCNFVSEQQPQQLCSADRETASAGSSGAPSQQALWCTLSCLRTNEWGLLVLQRQSLMELTVLLYMHVHSHLAGWRVRQRHSCPLCFFGMYSGLPQLKHSSYQKFECICLRWVYCQLAGKQFSKQYIQVETMHVSK